MHCVTNNYERLTETFDTINCYQNEFCIVFTIALKVSFLFGSLLLSSADVGLQLLNQLHLRAEAIQVIGLCLLTCFSLGYNVLTTFAVQTKRKYRFVCKNPAC